MSGRIDPRSRGGLNPRIARPFATERIFPIRHLVDEVSDWSTSEGSSSSPKDGVFKEPPRRLKSQDIYDPPPYPPIPPEDRIKKLPEPEDIELWSEDSQDEGGPPRKRYLTQRSQLVPEKFGGEPGVLPGPIPPDIKTPVFHRCEDEPIHIPGAIQQYGALVVVRYDEFDRLSVRIASENCKAILGYGVEALFGLSSFVDIIADNQTGDFLTRTDHVLQQGHDPNGNTDLDVFEVSIISTLPGQGTIAFWCALHLSAGSEDLLICEFEVQNDLFFPGDPGRHTLPRVPTRTLDNDVVEEERLKSVTRMSQPLRVLQIAQEQEHRIGFMEMFNAMSQIQSQLAACDTVQNVLDVVVGLVSEVSGFHRVMVYRFDQAANGCVEAELVDPRASDDLFRGLHFPASDIPKQARDLYRINKIRILFDKDHETARLVGREDSDFERPIDLTHSFLRAMSPIHLKYLTNMGVRSSMSISLIIDDELWGLVACHSYGEEGIRVSLPIRELCRNIGECASINIARLLLMHRLRSRGPPPDALHSQKNPSAFIAASSADLLRIFDADFGILSIQDEGRAIGRLEPYREALALLAHLQKKRLTTIVASQNVRFDFPTLKYAPGIKSIAGLLFIPLSMRGSDFIVFFRRAQLKEVRWAGNPYEKVIRSGTAEYLEPRSSFRRWTETVVGMSREWTDDQLETAAILSLLYGRFIDVWRQKELASQKSRLTKLLLQNSSHEVRTPLNAIINYLEIALECPLETNIRESLESAHKASKSLVYVIDDLLNLAKAEMKDIMKPQETFDLRSTVAEVITTFRKAAMRKDLELTVSTHTGLPEMVKGEAGRLRQVLTNLATNALQHTTHGEITVDIRPIKSKQTSSVVAITVIDAGSGMSETQLDDLFQEFEQILDEDAAPANTHSNPIQGEKKEILGLGLSVVARYVRNMNGKIRVQSEPGRGTMFTLELPFEHATAADMNISSMHEVMQQAMREVEAMRPRQHGTYPLSHTPLNEMGPSSGSTYTANASYAGTPYDGPPPFHHPLQSPRAPYQQFQAQAYQQPFQQTYQQPHQQPYQMPHHQQKNVASPAVQWALSSLGIQLPNGPLAAPTQTQKFQEIPHRPISRRCHSQMEIPTSTATRSLSGSSSTEQSSSTVETYPFPDMSGTSSLAVLIAEDNPVNAKVLRRRLEKSGHAVTHMVDGQACHEYVLSTKDRIDVILMDIQMPLIDGCEATRLIRTTERERSTPGNHQRVPIIAVSASLKEDNLYDYVADGFDAWLLKPIDFDRLGVLLSGIQDRTARHKALYTPGIAKGWERGGWLLP